MRADNQYPELLISVIQIRLIWQQSVPGQRGAVKTNWRCALTSCTLCPHVALDVMMEEDAKLTRSGNKPLFSLPAACPGERSVFVSYFTHRSFITGLLQPKTFPRCPAIMHHPVKKNHYWFVKQFEEENWCVSLIEMIRDFLSFFIFSLKVGIRHSKCWKPHR